MAKARQLVPLLAFLFCVPAAIPAQQPAQSEARYTLRGSVVNSVTGEPIRKALVEATGPLQRTAFTGVDGQFELEGLPGGDYYPMARRQGYADCSSIGCEIKPFHLGSDNTPLVLKLTPLARISGRVLDSEGEPVPNLNVQCLHEAFQQGHKMWQRGQGSDTDESGNFLIDALIPGKYIVFTTQQEVHPGMFTDDPVPGLIYRKQYYPNAPDFSAAQPISLSPGEESRADITVTTTKGARVFFSVNPPQQQWVRATLADEAGDQVEAPVRPHTRAGGWVLPSVPSGSWRLQVEVNNNGEELSGGTPIQVGETDLKNVVVALSPRAQVPIVFTGSSKTGSPPASVQLFSPAGSMNFTTFSNMSSPFVQDNHFPIVGVPPGSYHVQANPAGDECVESVTSGSSDLTRVDYVIPGTGAPQPIEVALRSDCATLEISTTPQAGESFVAVVVGGPNTLEPLTVFGGGQRTLKLSPGEYDVFAFPNANNIEYANPDILRNYTGHHISVAPNQNETLHVEINNPGESR